MSLANLDLEALRKRILAAYKADDPVLQKFRDYAVRLKSGMKKVRPHAVNAVSFVASDGGDNRLVFNPATIELVRVADSRGNDCALDVIASTSTIGELNRRGSSGDPLSVPALVRLCSDLGKKVTELSFLLGGFGKPGKSTGAMRTYRDIVEWAVLYDLITDPRLQWGGDTILVREGMLRTKAFKKSIFPKIDQKIREGVARHKKKNVDLTLVAVAKQNAVLGRLAVALELEATFHKDYPCYVRVPKDIADDCYNYDLTWLENRETLGISEEDENQDYASMGEMFLVKFGDRPFDPVWPVDIASDRKSVV